jgi:hypothetical protein
MKNYLLKAILGLSVIFATAVSADVVELESWDYIFSRVELFAGTEDDRPELEIVVSGDSRSHLFLLVGDASTIFWGADKGRLTIAVDCGEPQDNEVPDSENACGAEVQHSDQAEPASPVKLLLKLPFCGSLGLSSLGSGCPTINADSLCCELVECFAKCGDLHLPCATVRVKIDAKPGVTVYATGASSKEHFDKGLFLFTQSIMGPALWEAFYFRSENKFKEVSDPTDIFSGYGEYVI